LIRRSQLRWRPIAALPRPFRCTPGRLSRGYHSQEEGLEINLRGYRPTIFVLHRGRWGTGEFRRQPFSDLEFSCKRILRFRRRQSSAKRLLRILFLQLLHKIYNSGLTSAHGQSREHRFWTAVSQKWTCQQQSTDKDQSAAINVADGATARVRRTPPALARADCGCCDTLMHWLCNVDRRQHRIKDELRAFDLLIAHGANSRAA
jgi:hypothetical protein